MMGLQYLENNFALEFTYSLTSQLLQRELSVDRYFGVEEVGFARSQIAGNDLFVAQDHVTLDQIFQLADISRPVVFAQVGHQLVGDRQSARIILAVIVGKKIVG